MAYREQLERNFCHELEQLRERLGPEAANELDEIEQNATAFIDHECDVLNEIVELLVHPDERAGVRDRAAQNWPWSRPYNDISQTFFRARGRALTPIASEDLPPGLVACSDLPHPTLVVEWMQEGIARHGRGVEVDRLLSLSPNAGWRPRNDVQMTLLYLALPEAIRQVRSLRMLLALIVEGDSRHLIRKIAPAALAKCGKEPTTDRVEALAAAVRQHIIGLRQAIPLLCGPPPATAAAADDCARKLDFAFANYVENLGTEGKAYAAVVRQGSNDRFASQGPRWHLWCSHASGERFLRGLARVLWTEEVEQRNSATPFALSAARVGGDRFSTLPKTTAAVSWAFGGAAMREVTVEGDRYAPAPLVASRLLPRSLPLLADIKGHERKPHQTVLALDDGLGEALPVAVAGATNYAITPLAAKVAVLALASDSLRRGQMQRLSLLELTRLLNPGAKRIRTRELQATAVALDELRRLFVYLPDNRKVQLFDTTSAAKPQEATGDLPVLIGLTRSFTLTLKSGITGPSLSGNEYRGEFLVNLDGLMRIPTKRPSLLRHGIRAHAHWNAAFKPGSKGAFDADMLPVYTAEKWAAITNALPPGVVEYLQTNNPKRRSATQRAQWSKDRKAMFDDLAKLEAMGLVVIAKPGKDVFRLLPPAPYLEAWSQARKTGRRSDPEGDE